MEMKKDERTTPPSTPQGPARNDLLTDEPYRSGPYPGDDPAHPTGEGSGGSSHPTGMPETARAQDDITAPQLPASTPADLDHERPGGMSGGLGKVGDAKST